MIPKTEGIVLRRIDFRETSRIATFFTKDYGKVKGVLKGIRKDSKKFGSNIDKFSVNDIVYYQYRNSDLHLISHCDLKNYFFPIRQDLKRSIAANYLLELVDIIMPPEEPNRKIYTLMMNFLESLQTEKDINKLIFILQVKILILSGFQPHLDACVVSGKKVKGKAKFSLKHGGLVSPDVKITDGPMTIISSGTIASILHIEKNSWKNCLKLGLTKTVQRESKYILNNFLVYHLGRKLKSERFIQ